MLSLCLRASVRTSCPSVVSLSQSLCQDVLSYQRVIDGLLDKAQSLARSSHDAQITADATAIDARFSQLCSLAKVRNDASDLLEAIILTGQFCVGALLDRVCQFAYN